MTSIQFVDDLPVVSVVIELNKQTLSIDNVLLDTGSAACVFRSDDLSEIGLIPEPTDTIRRMSGIGGDEFVFEKTVTSLTVGQLKASEFTIQLGAVDYGININGILGVDFLNMTGAKLDFAKLTVTS